MKILFLGYFLFSNLSFFSGQSIYKDINVGAYKLNVPLKVVNDGSINAYSTCGMIAVNTGTLKLSPDAVAFVLAHEMGHQLLKHTIMKNGECVGNTTPKTSEADADRMAIKILKASGKYDACKGGRELFSTLMNRYGDGGGPNDEHPSNSWRLKQVEDMAC